MKDAKKPILSGFAPLRKLYFRYLVFGAFIVAAGALFAVIVGGAAVWQILSMAVALGGCLSVFGAWGLKVGGAAQVLSSSLNLVHAGKLAEASLLLRSLENNTSPGVVASGHVQRAMIALRTGDLEVAERHATAVISAPPRLLFRSVHEAQRCAAFGIRAWARAAKGDLDGAKDDVRATRECPVPVPEALAHASLAEAMVDERKGDRAALASVLRRDRRLLLGSLDVRERAVVRAMQRLLKASPKSIYRTPAETKKDQTEDAPTIALWLDRVAPQLSAFALQPRAAASIDKAEAPELLPSESAVAKVKAEAPKKPFPTLGKVVLLWGLLIAMFLAIWQLLAAQAPAEHVVSRSPAEPAGPLSMLWGVGIGAFLIGLFAWMVRRAQGQTRRLHRLAAAIATGQDVDAELTEMAASKQRLVAAQAELLRASVADRRAALAQGIAHIDAARMQLHTDGLRAAASGMLSPALTGARAYMLAALGRTDEAAAELQQIPQDYLYYDKTQFIVKLVALLATGDIDGAGRLCQATPPELSIGPRDELLRDLVRAVTLPSGASAMEIARLRDELREDDESRVWIERVAPLLLARFEQATACEDEDEAGEGEEGSDEEGSDEEAEREAMAEEEASEAEAARSL